MDAKVTWSKRLSFIGEADTGFSVPLGANPQVGGDNDGFRPMELIAIKRRNTLEFSLKLKSSI